MRVVDAQYIMNTLIWLDLDSPSNKFKFRPKLNKEGLYECKFIFPKYIGGFTLGVGTNKLDAINNAAKLAWNIIETRFDEVKDFPLCKKAFCGPNEWVAIEDENGEFTIELNNSKLPSCFA